MTRGYQIADPEDIVATEEDDGSDVVEVVQATPSTWVRRTPVRETADKEEVTYEVDLKVVHT